VPRAELDALTTVDDGKIPSALAVLAIAVIVGAEGLRPCETASSAVFTGSHCFVGDAFRLLRHFAGPTADTFLTKTPLASLTALEHDPHWTRADLPVAYLHGVGLIVASLRSFRADRVAFGDAVPCVAALAIEAGHRLGPDPTAGFEVFFTLLDVASVRALRIVFGTDLVAVTLGVFAGHPVGALIAVCALWDTVTVEADLSFRTILAG